MLGVSVLGDGPWASDLCWASWCVAVSCSVLQCVAVICVGRLGVGCWGLSESFVLGLGRIRKLGGHLDLLPTSRANPVKWRSTHNKSGA